MGDPFDRLTLVDVTYESMVVNMKIQVPVADAPCCAPITSELDADEAVETARLFAALSDPVRLRLFSMVAAQGEVCSCNLEEPLGKSQPTTSHHTKVLAEAGLLVGEKRGRWVWWQVSPTGLDALRTTLATPA
jgi:ArsR family transcriptional regulator